MCVLVPVDTVPMTVLYCMPEMKVEVQDIEAVVPSQCSTVEVPFNHIPPQGACQRLKLWQEKTPSDTLPQGHCHVPHQQAGVWQHLVHAHEYSLQVLSVALH